NDVAKAVADVKGGKISFRVDKAANLHAMIGKASFDAEKLAENYGALLDELLRIKPASSKGIYLKKVTLSTTNGPGIPVDSHVQMNYADYFRSHASCWLKPSRLHFGGGAFCVVRWEGRCQVCHIRGGWLGPA